MFSNLKLEQLVINPNLFLTTIIPSNLKIGLESIQEVTKNNRRWGSNGKIEILFFLFFFCFLFFCWQLLEIR